jgi:protocatechuate 3,4-dioxygenase beta subunit
VTTNGSGVASVTATANATGGAYVVNASVSGAATPAAFNLQNLVASSVVASAGTPQTTIVGSAFSTALQVTVTDASSNPIPGATVTFAAPGSGASASLSSTTVTTNSSGVASVTATANSTAGSYAVTASVAGVVAPATFGLTNTNATITATAGNNQTATISTLFPSQLQVQVLDSNNNPISGKTVVFQAPGSGARATFGGSSSSTNTTTDANGYAATSSLLAGSTAGSYSVTATIQGTAISTSFTLQNSVGAASTITVVSGNNQVGPLGGSFSQPLVAVVKDSGGNLVPGVSVTFNAPVSGASATFSGGGSSATVTTDSSGNATSLGLSPATATGSYSVSAKVNNSSPSVNFSLTNTSAVPASISVQGGSPQSTVVNTNFGAVLQAKVLDTLGNPSVGATVTFTVPNSGASGAFSGSTNATATTDSSGIATSPTLKANTTSGTFFAQASVSGVASTANYTLTNTPDTPVSISIFQGTPQYAVIGKSFAVPLVAQVKDVYGNPVSGAAVAFLAPTVGSTATFPGPTNTTTVTTDSAGKATAPTLTANSVPGSYTLTASITTGSYVDFNLSNSPLPYSIAAQGGSTQSTQVLTAFGTALQVIVKDSLGQVVPGASVTFAVPASGSSASLSATTVVTDASGIASVTATANGTPGSYAATGTVAGLATSATFNLTNTVGAPTSITATGGSTQTTGISTAFASALQATVRDTSNNPVPNVLVSFTVVPSAGAGANLSSSSATTDSSGIASVTATANGTVGSYTATASVAGVATSASFALTNQAGTISSASLIITMSPPSPGLNIGSNSTYTLTVSNNGAGVATTAQVKDQLPSGLTFVAATGKNWNCSNTSGLVTCNFSGGSIAATNGTSTIAIVVKTNVGQAGIAQVNYASIDPTGGSSPPAPGASCTSAGSCASNASAVTDSKAKAEALIYNYISRRADQIANKSIDVDRLIDRLSDDCEVGDSNKSTHNSKQAAPFNKAPTPQQFKDAEKARKKFDNQYFEPTFYKGLSYDNLLSPSTKVNSENDNASSLYTGINAIINGLVSGYGGQGSGLSMSGTVKSKGGDASVSGSIAAIQKNSMQNNNVRRCQNKSDVWFDETFRFLQSGNTSGFLNLGRIGLDYKVNSRVLLGFMFQFDNMADRYDVLGAKISGFGWMAGPYFAYRFADNLYLDGRMLAGMSSNSISPYMTYVDKFTTDRRLGSIRLSGKWSSDKWTLVPSAEYVYFQDASRNYIDSNNLTIGSQKAIIERLVIGPELSYRKVTSDKMSFDAALSFKYLWDGGQAVSADINQTALGFSQKNASRGHGELGLSLLVKDDKNSSVGVKASYLGMAGDRTSAISLGLQVRNDF